MHLLGTTVEKCARELVGRRPFGAARINEILQDAIEKSWGDALLALDACEDMVLAVRSRGGTIFYYIRAAQAHRL